MCEKGLNWDLLNSKIDNFLSRAGAHKYICSLFPPLEEINISLSPWPGRFAPVRLYKERPAHHVASSGPGGSIQTRLVLILN